MLNFTSKTVCFFRFLLLFTLYFLTGKAGLQLVPVSGFATLVWAPSGIALAFLILYGLGLWPAIMLAAFCVNLSMGASLPLATGIALGNTLEAVLGCYLLLHYAHFKPQLVRVKDVLALAFYGAFLSTLVSATFGTASLWLTGTIELSQWGKTWEAWWVGDALGDLIIAPLILIFTQKVQTKLSWLKRLEALVLAGLTIVGSFLVFSDLYRKLGISDFPLPYTLFPFAIWSAFRFGLRGATLTSFAVSAIAIWGTTFDHSLFAIGRLSDSLLYLETFCGIYVLGALLVAASLAERDALQVTLLDSEARFRAVFNQAATPMSVIDLNGNWISFNDAYQKMFGYSREEMQSMKFSDLTHPEDQAADLTGIRQALEGKAQAFLREKRYFHKNGSLIWMMANISLVKDAKHKPKYFVAVLQDITERKQWEQKMLEQKERMYSLFQDAPAGISIFTGPNFIREFMNEANSKFYPSTQVLGTALRDTIASSPDSDALISNMQKVYETGEPLVKNEVLIRVDQQDPKQNRFINSVMQPTYDTQGNIDGVVSFVIDVTEQVNARSHAERLLAEQLQTQAELEKTELALRAALKARDEFISIASHELKTPITIMKLQHQVLARDLQLDRIKPGSQRLELLTETTVKQLDQITRLVDDMLDVSRINNGKLSMKAEPCDLVELVQEVSDKFASQLDQAQCRIELKLEPKIQGHWDRARIEQVLANLLSNAIKYASGQPVTITLSKASGYAKLSVQDHGPGIPEAYLEKIFHRFERVSSAQHSTGLGLGLYISRQIVDMHGGKIWAESRPGAGSTFTVELPI